MHVHLYPLWWFTDSTWGSALWWCSVSQVDETLGWDVCTRLPLLPDCCLSCAQVCFLGGLQLALSSLVLKTNSVNNITCLVKVFSFHFYCLWTVCCFRVPSGSTSCITAMNWVPSSKAASTNLKNWSKSPFPRHSRPSWRCKYRSQDSVHMCLCTHSTAYTERPMSLFVHLHLWSRTASLIKLCTWNSVSQNTIGNRRVFATMYIFPCTLPLQGQLQDYVWPKRCQIHSVPSAPGSLHWADADFLHTEEQWRKSAWTQICLLQNAVEWVDPLKF